MVRIPFKHVMVSLEILVLNNALVFLMTEKQNKNRMRNGSKSKDQVEVIETNVTNGIKQLFVNN